MGISTTSARNYRMQEFTSSGTWTCPAGTNLVEVLLVGAGGGGGTGGAGGSHVTNNYSSDPVYGGAGGGGGGGGEILRRLVRVTPGQTYSVTIGAGGAGGQLGPAITGSIYNLIWNPSFETNTTGWTLVTGNGFTMQSNAIADRSFVGRLVTNASGNASVRFDTGTITQPFITGGNVTLGLTLRRSGTAAGANGTLSIECFNSSNASIGTYTSPSSSLGTSNSTNATLHYNLTPTTFTLPSGTARVTFTFTVTGGMISENIDIDAVYVIPDRVSSSTSSGWQSATPNAAFKEPSSVPKLVYWSGAADASYIMYYPFSAGRGLAETGTNLLGASSAGNPGSAGGSTSFGSLAVASGGSGGNGGISGNWARDPSSTIRFWQAHATERSASTVGNSGGTSANTTLSNRAPEHSGGGASQAYWSYPYIQDALVSSYNSIPVQIYYPRVRNSRGYRGTPSAIFAGSADQRAVSLDTQFIQSAANPGAPRAFQTGGDATDGYGYGGGGGSGGFEVTVTSGSSFAAGTSYRSLLDSITVFPAANGGRGGPNGGPTTNAEGNGNGAGYAGEPGLVGSTFGSGGGGGGGGGAPSHGPSSASSQLAKPGDGGAGGNGADGYALIMWWEG